MEDAMDYGINTVMSLEVSGLYDGDVNLIGAEDYIKKEITKWIFKAFNLPDFEQEDFWIDFKFYGKRVDVAFRNEICDDSQEDAESFISYCIGSGPDIEGIKYLSHSMETEELGATKH